LSLNRILWRDDALRSEGASQISPGQSTWDRVHEHAAALKGDAAKDFFGLKGRFLKPTPQAWENRAF